MKYFLSTIGSVGDIQPFVALASELKQQGHDVVVCSLSDFSNDFTEVGVEFKKAGPDVDINWLKDQVEKINTLSPVKGLNYMFDQLYFNIGEQYYKDCLSASVGADFAICLGLDIFGQHAVIENNIPYANVFYFPAMMKTNYKGPGTLPNLGKFINIVQWKLFGLLFKRVEKKLNQMLIDLNGNNRNIELLNNFSPSLNFLACSKHLGGTVQPDFIDNLHVTGGWVNHKENYIPPVELTTFIEQQSPSVIFNFGSMSAYDSVSVQRICMEATKKANVSAIFMQGWGSEEIENSNNRFFFASGYIPHDYLFQHTNIVVHHGGAGTTLSACKTGASSIVVPHMGDQDYWAKTMLDLGVAGPSIPRKKLTSDKLADAITTMLNGDYTIQTKVLKEKLASEHGVKETIRILDKHLN